jgi:hypothetical protein
MLNVNNFKSIADRAFKFGMQIIYVLSYKMHMHDVQKISAISFKKNLLPVFFFCFGFFFGRFGIKERC